MAVQSNENPHEGFKIHWSYDDVSAMESIFEYEVDSGLRNMEGNMDLFGCIDFDTLWKSTYTHTYAEYKMDLVAKTAYFEKK